MSRHRNIRSRTYSHDEDYDSHNMFSEEDETEHAYAPPAPAPLVSFLQPTEADMENCYYAVLDRLPNYSDRNINDAIYDANYDAEQAISNLLAGVYGPPEADAEASKPAEAPAPAPAPATPTPVAAEAPASGKGEGAGISLDKDFRKAVVKVLGASPSPHKPPKGGKSKTRKPKAQAAPQAGAGAGDAGAGAVGGELDGYKVDDIDKAIDVPVRKPVVNLVVVGHVDAGKSTLMGHLLFALGGVSSKEMHKMKREADIVGKGSFAYAWVLDQHTEERTRGVTMDVGVHFFETDNRRVVLLDTPGHRDFIPNMITGAAQADAAVLVIPARQDEFEDAFSENGQTREHAVLVRSLGVKHVVVAVNKMDTVDWSKERFNSIKAQVGDFLKREGYKSSYTHFVPVSGLEGTNLVEGWDDRKFRWYDGPTLLQALDNLPETSRPVDKPLRLCISDVYKRLGLGITVTGKIDAGRIVPGNRVILQPSGKSAGVKGLEIGGITAEVATAGENVEVGLGGIPMDALRAGMILCHPRHPVPLAMKIKAQIFTLPTLRIPMVAGQQLTLHMHHLEEACNVTKLLRTLDKNGKHKVRRPRCLLKKQTADVRIKFLRPVPLELFSENRRLGRFMLRYNGKTVAAGIVRKIMK